MSNPFYQGAVALIFTDENITAICYRISILCTGTGDTVLSPQPRCQQGRSTLEYSPDWSSMFNIDMFAELKPCMYRRHCKTIRFNLILYWMIYRIIYCHLIQVHSIQWNSSSDDSITDTAPPAAHSAPPVPSHQEPPPERGHWRQASQSLQQQQQGTLWTSGPCNMWCGSWWEGGLWTS